MTEQIVATQATEIEYKFKVADLFQINELSVSSAWTDWQSERPGKKFHVHAEYFDTADRQLDAVMAALRLRREGEKRIMTLKFVDPSERVAPTDETGLFQRIELAAELPGDFKEPPIEIFAQQISNFWQIIPRTIAQALNEPLRRYYVIDFARQQRYLVSGKSDIELSLDQGFFRNQAGVEQPFLEAEFELVSGTLEDLQTLVDYAKQTFDLTPQPLSKYESCVALDKIL
ncbi:MAG TPA: CYTH domain-containing protein [Clostridiaceae bacterium]|nr:CYTH domain-containing protein [Clostridiaceae bacterium]